MPDIPKRDPPPEDALARERLWRNTEKIRIYLKHINAEQALLTSTNSIKQQIGQIISYTCNTTFLEQAMLTSIKQVDRTFSYNTIFVEQAMLTSTY